MANIKKVGDGEVVLISGGGKVMTDIAARFVASDKKLEDIIASPYTKEIVKHILDSGHLAATEFDNFIFGVSGFSRVTEVQLVRKRIASYMIRSGRTEKKGKREFDVVLPDDELLKTFISHIQINPENITVFDKDTKTYVSLIEKHPELENAEMDLSLDSTFIINTIEKWYLDGLTQGVSEENLRYLKPQATEFKAIIMMNAHALMDWFRIRCCMNAQCEIRTMANKMLALVKEVSPDLFANAGSNCTVLGYCPENDRQNANCVGKIPTHKQLIDLWKNNSNK